MTSRGLARVAREWADQQTARFEEMPGLRGTFLTVTSVTGGVFLSWRTATVKATKVAASYTPAVGDRVLVLQIDNQIVVVGQMV